MITNLYVALRWWRRNWLWAAQLAGFMLIILSWLAIYRVLWLIWLMTHNGSNW